MYYDNCTRKNHDGTDGYTNYFWCPNPNDVDDQNTFSIDEGDTIGECTEFLYPPGKYNHSGVQCTYINEQSQNLNNIFMEIASIFLYESTFKVL